MSIYLNYKYYLYQILIQFYILLNKQFKENYLVGRIRVNIATIKTKNNNGTDTLR